MSNRTMPRLVMGSIITIGIDDEEGIPFDEAVIHFEGDEDSEISVHCPAAIAIAPMIVEAVNSFREFASAKAIISILANTAPQEWLTKKEIHAALSDYRAASSLPDHRDDGAHSQTVIVP